MDVKTLFAVLSVIIGVAGTIPYLTDILRHKTQPHAFTWLIITITQGTATTLLWYGGGGIGAIGPTIGIAFVALVFIMSLFYGTRDVAKSDVAVLATALLAIATWWLLENPLLSVILLSVIDVGSYIPTFRKSYSRPWTETALTWSAFAVANIFAILALENYNALTLTYLVSITLANIGLVLFLLYRRRQIAPRS